MSPIAPRTALVTGAAKRIGREIALTLAANGWQVAVHYRASQQEALNTAADCERFGLRAATFDADLEDEDTVRALLPRVISCFGQVDAIVNNAALFRHDTAATFSITG